MKCQRYSEECLQCTVHSDDVCLVKYKDETTIPYLNSNLRENLKALGVQRVYERRHPLEGAENSNIH